MQIYIHSLVRGYEGTGRNIKIYHDLNKIQLLVYGLIV